MTFKKVLGNETLAEKESAEIFKALSFHKYEYIDQEKNRGTRYGIVEETVQKVVPQFVETLSEFVPNLYQKASAFKIRDDSREGRYFMLHPVLEMDAAVIKELTLPRELLVYDPENVPITVLLVEASPYTLKVEMDRDRKEDLPKELFLYGTYEDCPRVNKGALAEMGLIVLKALLKRVERLERALLERETQV